MIPSALIAMLGTGGVSVLQAFALWVPVTRKVCGLTIAPAAQSVSLILITSESLCHRAFGVCVYKLYARV